MLTSGWEKKESKDLFDEFFEFKNKHEQYALDFTIRNYKKDNSWELFLGNTLVVLKRGLSQTFGYTEKEILTWFDGICYGYEYIAEAKKGQEEINEKIRKGIEKFYQERGIPNDK